MRLFEIGDKVIVTNPLLLYAGGIGLIVEKKSCDNKMKYIVKFSNGNKDIFTRNDLAFYRITPQKTNPLSSIKKVIFSGKKTILIFEDGSKSIVSCAEGETFDPYTGFCTAFTKAYFGSKAKIEKMVMDAEYQPSKETKKQYKEISKILKDLRKNLNFEVGDVVIVRENYPSDYFRGKRGVVTKVIIDETDTPVFIHVRLPSSLEDLIFLQKELINVCRR